MRIASPDAAFRDPQVEKYPKIADFSGCETVKLTQPNRINKLQPKIPQFHSSCETVKLCEFAREEES